MKSKDNKKKEKEILESDLIAPVGQMRPDCSEETINTSPSAAEVRAAVEEMNPDENSMNSRG